MALTFRDRLLKRVLDIFLSIIGLLCLAGIIVIAFIVSTIDTRKNGFFTQVRVGKDGKLFRTIKIRTMRDDPDCDTSVTRKGDPRVTRLGAVLRRTKIDELPQLINILLGTMSFVGPRPDVPGYADRLVGEDRLILTVRPGITGPATLKFRNEEELLASQADPEAYNADVLYPEKVRLNKEYVNNYTFFKDIEYLLRTLFNLQCW